MSHHEIESRMAHQEELSRVRAAIEELDRRAARFPARLSKENLAHERAALVDRESNILTALSQLNNAFYGTTQVR